MRERRELGHQNQWFNADGSPLGDPRVAVVPPLLPDAPDVRADIADYDVSLDRLDASVGIVLDAVDAAGRAGDTLIVCTTDHGVPFPEHKGQLTDAGTGVLLILRGPGFAGGRRIAAMVTHLDVVPTILERIGIAPPHALEGTSLAPLVAGKVDALHEAIFGETNYHAAYEPARSVRTATHLYVRRYGGRVRRVLPNCDPSPTRREMIARHWADELVPAEALYDVVADPHARANLIDDAAHADDLRDLRARLDARMRATDDPLLTLGHVPPWPGMKTTPATATYPGDPTVPAESLFATQPKGTP